MTDQDYRDTIARNWMSKAYSAFRVAEICLEEDALVSCVNRLYYSAFYAVSALLAADGVEYGKHTAVRSAFNRDMIKSGRVPQHFGNYYNSLYDDRLAGDYTPETQFQREDLSEFVAQTREFLEYIRKLIQ